MYTEFYEFSGEPFTLNPNPKFLYLSPSHYEALSSMMSGIKERKGIVVITGEAGVGKTTLIYALLKDLSEKIKTAFIFQTRLDFRDLLKNILRDLEVPINEKEENIPSFLFEFRRYLNERLNRDETVTIIIDEAQSLDDEVLRDLVRLSLPDTPAAKSPQIVLVGHPELEVSLNSEQLRPLKGQVAVHRKIRPLTRAEARKYIRHRLKIVGGDISEVFTSEAVKRVWEFAEGIPRVINLLCDRALLNGYLASSPIIDSKITEEVIKDFSYLQPRKSGIFREVFNQVKFHYKIIGIFFLFLGGLGFFSLLPRDSGLSILKAMVDLLPSMERPMGIGGNILPSEKQPIKITGKIPPSGKRPSEKREEEMKQPIPTPAIKPGPAEGPKVAGKKEAPSEKQASQPAKAKGYVIQVSAMRDLNLAKEFVETQKRRGQQVYLAEIKMKDRRVWYIVYIGSFGDEAQAARYMMEKKVKTIFPDCFIQKLS
jgi:general secretion pathway protein A